ncbi:MAG: hypothetical protein JNJ49_05125 [Bdellovibrionaceae bacterium]|nr:hypothetical protein [Pseudobdellovibrionaceae bacterium]
MKLRFTIAVGVLFVPLLICFVLDREYWPYSHFPLFVRPPEPFRWVRIMGVRSDGTEELVTNDSYAWPYGLVRLAFTVENLVREGREQDARKMIARLGERARRRQLGGGADGFVYKALRVYRIQYAPGLRPYSDQHFTEKVLIGEGEL